MKKKPRELPSEGSAVPKGLRKLSIEERRKRIKAVRPFDRDEWEAISCSPNLLELSDLMVESAVGSLPVPLGVVSGLVIDGEELIIPMAVEEPSVIAAVSYAGGILSRGGGLRTWCSDPVMKTQIFLEGVPAGKESEIYAYREEIEDELKELHRSLKDRGGGYKGLEVLRLPDTNMVRVHLLIDVRDAMGANILNTAAEKVRPLLEKVSGGKALMSILSNDAALRRAGARFSLSTDILSPLNRGGLSSGEIARRIVLASDLAREDESRAVTHNKGIMNGISSLALATGNDTRAVEAAAHAWAAREGGYRGLSTYHMEGNTLGGSLELPLPLATVGGAVGFHPASRFSLKLLGNPDAGKLARIAAALGLAQNFAALLALVTEGIQRGHMKHHAARLAYQAGARGQEVRLIADILSERGNYTLAEAVEALSRHRIGKDGR